MRGRERERERERQRERDAHTHTYTHAQDQAGSLSTVCPAVDQFLGRARDDALRSMQHVGTKTAAARPQPFTTIEAHGRQRWPGRRRGKRESHPKSIRRIHQPQPVQPVRPHTRRSEKERERGAVAESLGRERGGVQRRKRRLARAPSLHRGNTNHVARAQRRGAAARHAARVCHCAAPWSSGPLRLNVAPTASGRRKTGPTKIAQKAQKLQVLQSTACESAGAVSRRCAVGRRCNGPKTHKTRACLPLLHRCKRPVA